MDDSIISLPRFSYPPPEFEQVNFPNLLQKIPALPFSYRILTPCCSNSSLVPLLPTTICSDHVNPQILCRRCMVDQINKWVWRWCSQLQHPPSSRRSLLVSLHSTTQNKIQSDSFFPSFLSLPSFFHLGVYFIHCGTTEDRCQHLIGEAGLGTTFTGA